MAKLNLEFQKKNPYQSMHKCINLWIYGEDPKTKSKLENGKELQLVE